MSRVRPARLRVGSKVALVSPAGPVAEPMLRRGVGILESWGLVVEVGEHVLDRHPTLPYLAGLDTHRAADLQKAWCDPTVDAVVCVRGGYGTMRMVDLLDWDAMAEAGPKVFAGSSDITTLHEEIGSRLNQVTLFSPLVGGELSFDVGGQKHFRQTLFEPESELMLTGPSATSMGDGVATGMLVGGNLSLLASGVGAPDAFVPPDGSLVLLEDVTEDPYRIDRMVTQLLRSGWFTGAAGIVLGSWTGCGPPDAVRDVVTDLLVGLGVPMVWELGFGHCPDQLTMPLGAEATLDADQATITLAEPALS
ncbi:S66 peptidase family protein [Actinophytocola oryzae]|uniref:Muramoyltetrapeptide carboxypeptidase n=1 Tax=Actinophytocola oryzae TaxID=502181 RepID=A0A4R7V7I0_9PSEU|nr:LD-carboxypeptidase [Actinophytocola oryzae]TDV43646.1 muramoyltetrapeptide carboxypeptidase [Actinophytocola oryzae]